MPDRIVLKKLFWALDLFLGQYKDIDEK